MIARDRYDSLFAFYAEQRGVDWRLLKAQAIAESGLDPDVAGTTDDLGLCQFTTATWDEMVERHRGKGPDVIRDRTDPGDAIHAQARMMGWLLKECGSGELALCAYNWGIGRVRRTFLEPGRAYEPGQVPETTRRYVTRVLALLSGLIEDALAEHGER